MKEGKEQRKVVKNDERRQKKKVEEEGVTISENLQDPAQ